MAKLIFGCGYLGRRVARRWLAAGEAVCVVTRSAARASEFAAEGFQPIVADVVRPESLASLPTASTVLYAIGYDRGSGKSLREVYVDGLRAVLDALSPDTGTFIYISSTGVYGQTDGQWIDEQSPCQPNREAGRVCLEAERMLAGHARGAQAILLRMAGLYGPGRIPNAQALRSGEPIAVAEQGWLNLIHVDDAAEVVLAAERRAPLARTYLVSDGAPVERAEYYAELARVLGAPAPRFVAPASEAPAALRSAASKRVDNRRMRAELDCTLRYPTYREGLAAIVAAEGL
jgi:nucleoside-diphosphate-sugar epimerase